MTEQTHTEQSDGLPPGFHWEYRDGLDGAGSYSTGRSVIRTPTVYRRAVGPWEVHEPSRETIVESRPIITEGRRS